MKKKALILFAAIFVFAMHAEAQVRWGVRAGANGATWGGDAVESFSDMLSNTGVATIEMKPDFHAGFYLQLPLSSAFSLEPGLFYSGKGTRFTQTIETNTLIKPTATLTDNAHYVEMPVLLKAHIGRGFQLFAGPQLAYLVDNRVNVEAGLLGLEYEYDWQVDPGLRKFDVGLVGGLGYEFANGINLQGGYEWGLSSLDEGRSNFNAYNRVVKVSLGYTFGK